ncbi:MAG: hypothetical protein H6Q90_1054 [Deltaproteobacteria bacterium]|nr:hypothetical protein [Deltaproteobacteria bacterium]
MKSLTLVLLCGAASCSDEPIDANPGGLSGGQPGGSLPEGGEIRHEHVQRLGLPEETWLVAYQFESADLASAEFPAPAEGGRGAWGNCVDERTTPTWPFAPLANVTFVPLTTRSLSGPGITGALTLPEHGTQDMVVSSTFRALNGATYGGRPTDVALTAAMSTPDADYAFDLGEDSPVTYHLPAAYTAPLGIGGAATVAITDHQDLELAWTPPPNDFGVDGHSHTKRTHFNYTLFVDTTTTPNRPLFLCFPETDGHQVIPALVIEALPATGQIVHANLTHYMEARQPIGPYAKRRFDLAGTYTNISAYEKL